MDVPLLFVPEFVVVTVVVHDMPQTPPVHI
jgi:hypothetical protein